VNPEAEWMAGRTRIDGEHLIAVRVVGWSRWCLKLTPSEFDRSPIGRLQVVHMQVDVHLLLLETRRPIRCHMVRGELHAHDPLAVDNDAVPVLVAVHDAAQEASPKPALGFDIASVKHNDSPDDLHAMLGQAVLSAAPPPVWLPLAEEGVHSFGCIGRLAGGRHHLDGVRVRLRLVHVHLGVEGLFA
jgi:hypothetical protein